MISGWDRTPRDNTVHSQKTPRCIASDCRDYRLMKSSEKISWFFVQSKLETTQNWILFWKKWKTFFKFQFFVLSNFHWEWIQGIFCWILWTHDGGSPPQKAGLSHIWATFGSVSRSVFVLVIVGRFLDLISQKLGNIDRVFFSVLDAFLRQCFLERRHRAHCPGNERAHRSDDQFEHGHCRGPSDRQLRHWWSLRSPLRSFPHEKRHQPPSDWAALGRSHRHIPGTSDNNRKTLLNHCSFSVVNFIKHELPPFLQLYMTDVDAGGATVFPRLNLVSFCCMQYVDWLIDWWLIFHQINKSMPSANASIRPCVFFPLFSQDALSRQRQRGVLVQSASRRTWRWKHPPRRMPRVVGDQMDLKQVDTREMAGRDAAVRPPAGQSRMGIRLAEVDLNCDVLAWFTSHENAAFHSRDDQWLPLV